jgi:ArsR family transcriptional regulator, virulence genes transcriptional regulator
MLQRYHTSSSGDHAEVADLAAFMTRTIGSSSAQESVSFDTCATLSESIWMPDASVLQINRASALLKALSGRGRLLLLSELGEGEKTVKELAQLAGTLQASTSQQLANLRRNGIVKTSGEQTSVFYSLSAEVRNIIAAVENSSEILKAAAKVGADGSSRVSAGEYRAKEFE